MNGNSINAIFLHENRSRSPEPNDKHSSYCTKMALRTHWFSCDEMQNQIVININVTTFDIVEPMFQRPFFSYLDRSCIGDLTQGSGHDYA